MAKRFGIRRATGVRSKRAALDRIFPADEICGLFRCASQVIDNCADGISSVGMVSIPKAAGFAAQVQRFSRTAATEAA